MAKDENTVQAVRCVIQRDWWDENGERHYAGEEVEVPVETAMDGVESGFLKRAKADE